MSVLKKVTQRRTFFQQTIRNIIHDVLTLSDLKWTQIITFTNPLGLKSAITLSGQVGYHILGKMIQQ